MEHAVCRCCECWRGACGSFLSRYEASAQCAWYRALEELRALQTNGALREIKINPVIEPEIPAIASIAAETLEHAFGIAEYDTAAYMLATRSRLPCGQFRT